MNKSFHSIVIKRLIIGMALVWMVVNFVSAVDTIQFTARKVRSVFAAGKEQTILSGSAQISTGSIVIKSEEILLYGTSQRYIESKGPVSIHDSSKNLDLRGDSMFYDRETDILRISGNAQMEDYKNEMLVRGGILESRNKENIAIIQVGVRIFKKDIVARAEMLVYRRDDDKVELSGLPVVLKKQDEYRASIITIDLKTEEIELFGKVKGNVQTKQKNASNESNSSVLPATQPVPNGVPDVSPLPQTIFPEPTKTPMPSRVEGNL